MAGKGGTAKSPMIEPEQGPSEHLDRRQPRLLQGREYRPSDRLEVWLRPRVLQAAAGQEGQGLASVWRYGCGLDFKQQPDNKAKVQRASGSTATASTSSSSRTRRPRPSERLEVRLRPRLQAAAGQQGQGPASVWKYGYGLDFKQHICMYTFVYVCMYIYIYMHARVCFYSRIYIYMYMYTCIHT